MKKLFLFFLIFFITSHAIAQSGIFFQAIARDRNANPAKDRKLYVQTNIIQSTTTGTIVLTEEHQTFTDAFGIFSILVGSGARVGGTVTGLSTIDWSKGPYYLNLKIVITPVTIGTGWDYNKEWVDIGTTIFGAVPFALYSANTANINNKLNAADTTKMLESYAKVKAVQVLSTSIDTKLATKDTATMLAPYAKKTYTDSALLTKMNVFDKSIYAKQAYVDTVNYIQQKFVDSSLQSKFNLTDTLKYTKQIFTDSALLTKMNVFDKSIYAKQAYVDSALLTKMNNFDTSRFAKQIFIDSALITKFNNTDTIKYTKLTYTDSALSTKFKMVDTINFTKQIYTDSALQTKLDLYGNALTATIAGNITATSNTTLTSLSNLNTVGTITSGVWSTTTIDIAHGGTGLTTAGLDGQVLSTASDGSLQWLSLTSSTTTHRIGERFGGGIVFYVYDNGKHGLIAATSDQATFVRWGTTTAVNAVRDGINAGMANTERIILVQGSAGDYAAQIAANYQGGGYGDWYLPSKYELNLLFQKKAFVGLFPGFTYWSSNESGSDNAWGQDFSDIWGAQFYTNRTQKHSSVRAIRSF